MSTRRYRLVCRAAMPVDPPATAMIRSGRGQTSHLERNFLRLWRDSPVMMFFLMVLACFGNCKVLEVSLLGSVLGRAQFHLIPTASKKLVEAPFQSLVHILQQPSCNYETLLTSSALDVEFFSAEFLLSNFPFTNNFDYAMEKSDCNRRLC